MAQQKIYSNYKDFYTTTTVAGNGGFAIVYKGCKKGTHNENIAIKVINFDQTREILLNRPEIDVNKLDDELQKCIEGFVKEFNNMKICSRCINSIKCYDYFINDNCFVIAMELCDRSLLQFLTERYLKNNRGFSFEEILIIMKQLNNAFKVMRDNKITHRDLKLENILLKKDPNKNTLIFKLSDYGCSKRMESLSKNLNNSLAGTLGYMAPEILDGKPYNYKCDLWSIGIIIYRLLFYKSPYSGENEVALLNNINTLGKRVIKPSGNKLLDDLLFNLLEKKPENRLDWKGYFDHPFFNQDIGILYLFLIKSLSEEIENVEQINNNKVKNIISYLKNKNELNQNNNEFLNVELDYDIITFSQYIGSIIKEKEINDLINLLGNDDKKKKIIELYKNLIKFKNLSQLFEKEFLEAQKNSYFEYSVISISLNLENNINKFLTEKRECQNCIIQTLFHGTRNEIVMKILNQGYIYSKRHFFGFGVYFTDMLDYVLFYSGGKSDADKRENWGKIIPINKAFSLVGNLVYYDKTKEKNIYDDSYFEKENENNLTYEEIKEKYPEKMIEKNGINTAKIELLKGRILNKEQIKKNEELGNILGKDYAITEMEQILPLYGITLKRNEFVVIWKNSLFYEKEDYTKYLINAKFNIMKNNRINVYIENNDERALNLVKRKKFNKIILISDLEGKQFVEEARKILGFEIIVLFFSKKKIPKWIKNFNNALYSDNENFYIRYIQNYNYDGLINLKKDVEITYGKQLKFTENFINFTNYIESGDYEKIYFNELSSNKLDADEISEDTNYKSK